LELLENSATRRACQVLKGDIRDVRAAANHQHVQTSAVVKDGAQTHIMKTVTL
jgi:hypothetical protein